MAKKNVLKIKIYCYGATLTTTEKLFIEPWIIIKIIIIIHGSIKNTKTHVTIVQLGNKGHTAKLSRTMLIISNLSSSYKRYTDSIVVPIESGDCIQYGDTTTIPIDKEVKEQWGYKENRTRRGNTTRATAYSVFTSRYGREYINWRYSSTKHRATPSTSGIIFYATPQV